MVCVWLRAAPALHVRSLLHEGRAGLLVTPPARIADGVCDNTGAGHAKREVAIRGSRAYGLMLPPGLFQPSHPRTLNNAGCLARYPPARV
jgi:hypothetical protein